MTETPQERGTDRSTVALDVHAVVNSLAAIQCQWFLLKVALTPERSTSVEVTTMDRLLSELSTRVEQLQTKVLVANKTGEARK
jgi:hypothetical protein